LALEFQIKKALRGLKFLKENAMKRAAKDIVSIV
jgi:hypothetical protein